MWCVGKVVTLCKNGRKKPRFTSALLSNFHLKPETSIFGLHALTKQLKISKYSSTGVPEKAV